MELNNHAPTVIAVLALLAPLTACSNVSSDATTGPTSRVAISPPPLQTDSIEIDATASTTLGPIPETTQPSLFVDRHVPVGAASMHVRCIGTGHPTIVLIAGFNDAGDNWGTIAPSLSRSSRVCSYARYGTGSSDPPPADQTFGTQATDLHSLLESVGEPGPYLLIGHSYGGSEAVTFASMFPAEVAGLVLLDASPVTWHEAICAVPDDGSAPARTFRQQCANESDPGANPERLNTSAAFTNVAAINSLGELPMIVLTATDHPFPGLAPDEASRLGAVWDAGQERWTSLSSSARLVQVDEAGHYVHVDQPRTVIDQVMLLLERVR